MPKRSAIDIAYEIIEKAGHGIPFYELWEEIVQSLDYSEVDKTDFISRFYTNLTLDGRFVNLGDNTWDLRKNNTYDKVHIDIEDVYTDVEEVDEDYEELEALKSEMGFFSELADYDDDEDDDE